jgi:hypothetical protein
MHVEEGAIENLVDFLKAVKWTNEAFPTLPWWRGQAQLEGWPLIPKVFRKNLDEPNLTASFMVEARLRHSTCPQNGAEDAYCDGSL